MTRKHPENDNPNVLCVHELAGSGCCKERSDGIAIVTLCVNRVQSYSLFSAVLIYAESIHNILPRSSYRGYDARNDSEKQAERNEKKRVQGVEVQERTDAGDRLDDERYERTQDV